MWISPRSAWKSGDCLTVFLFSNFLTTIPLKKKLRLLAFATAILLMANSAWSSQLGKKLNGADSKLNTVDQQVLKGLPHSAAKERFKAAQRA